MECVIVSVGMHITKVVSFRDNEKWDKKMLLLYTILVYSVGVWDSQTRCLHNNKKISVPWYTTSGIFKNGYSIGHYISLISKCHLHMKYGWLDR